MIDRSMKNRWIALYVENTVGVLAKVSGLFSGKSYNLQSLTVGTTEDETVSRMTICVTSDDVTFEQIKKQLNCMIEVIKVIDLTITIPVLVFVIPRKGAAFMIYSIRPDVFPAGKPPVAGISELNALITVVHIVMTPSVIRVAITTILNVCEILLPGYSSDSCDAISKLSDMVLVRELKLKSHMAVTVHILLGRRGSYNRRDVRASLPEKSCPFTMEVIE